MLVALLVLLDEQHGALPVGVDEVLAGDTHRTAALEGVQDDELGLARDAHRLCGTAAARVKRESSPSAVGLNPEGGSFCLCGGV